MRLSRLLFLLIIPFFSNSQTSTPSSLRLSAKLQRRALVDSSLVNSILFKSIGPTVNSGRVVDVDVNPENTSQFYVAYASGGLWYTENNGTTFKPVFDSEVVMTIGDIAVDWKNNLIWVGTGEVNSSRSSYSGVGVFLSKDGGKTWEHKGLGESHHIGRIILSPDKPGTIWVGALGHLYTNNSERGVFKSTDYGEHWKQTLYIDDTTGVVDMIIDPLNSSVFYAAAWHRDRRSWNFEGAGASSGIYKSKDGGETWTKISGQSSGLPQGAGIGRIGLAASDKNGKTILFTMIDNQTPKDSEQKEKFDGITKDLLRSISKEDFLNLEKEKLASFLKTHGFPKKYSASKIFEMVRNEKIKPITLVEFLEDANAALTDAKIIGAEIYRSNDEGKTWIRTHSKELDNLVYTYGYYFSQIRVQPHNPDKVYILGTRILKSDDGGKSFKSIQGQNMHWDHHALWLDPNMPGHIINGNDGGLNLTYDDGKNWIKCNSPAVGQFYAVNYDMAENYYVYGGLQDNGVWEGSSKSSTGVSWHESGHNDFKEVLGGDGMQVMVDFRDNKTIYSGFQFGNYFRTNEEKNEQKAIKPKHDLGERPLRFNWQTPILLSRHNQDVLYFGANKLYRSLDKGENFEAISEDLTSGGKKGNVPFGTITCISESPIKFGFLVCGTDDGYIHLTKDGGENWTKISDKLPQGLWVSRVVSSQYEKSKIYASLNGYRNDDMNTYLYMTNDYGSTWKKIGTDLPVEPINVVREDPVNENIIYVGTDHGLYTSLNQGKTFMSMMGELPNVAVHDLVIHPRDHEIIVGTHGRSIYKASVKELEMLDDSIYSQKLYLFPIPKTEKDDDWGKIDDQWSEIDTPMIKVPVYSETSGMAEISIYSEKNIILKKINTQLVKGLNYLKYDLSVDEENVDSFERSLNNIKEDKIEVEKKIRKSKKGEAKIDSKKENEIKLTKTDIGYYYLPKGKYSFVLTKDGNKKNINFEIN